MDLDEQSRELARQVVTLREQFGRTIVGHEEVLDYILKGLFSGGHLLIEGLPGLGKTLMVKTVAGLLGLKLSRVQFTPDLMPADILGVNILMEGEHGSRQFRFEKGPVFTNILLADEINRATPKTQSALLQVMEERFVTIFGRDYPTEEIFVTLATQNPIELRGTYPLPEAQVDRFMFKLNLESPDLAQLEQIARRQLALLEDSELPAPVLDARRVGEIRRLIRRVPVEEEYSRFAARLVRATDPGAPDSPEPTRAWVKYGSSPRGLIALLAAARVTAAFDGRFNLCRDDLRANYLAALRHRVVLNFEAQVQKVRVDDLLREVYEGLDRSH
jgi:MoxR-like ATPase